MTVKDLIEELEELPMDMPVVVDYKEISRVAFEEVVYYLDRINKVGYTSGPAVTLE